MLKINKEKFIVETFTVTLGSTLFSNWYYVDKTISTGNIVGAIVYESGSNRPCFCQIVGSNTFRVYSTHASITCSVRILRKVD